MVGLSPALGAGQPRRAGCTFSSFLSSWPPGIDGPAAFLKPDAQDPDTRLRVLSAGPSEAEPEGSADGGGDVDPPSKPDLQEILQLHGEDWSPRGGPSAPWPRAPFPFTVFMAGGQSRRDAEWLVVRRVRGDGPGHLGHLRAGIVSFGLQER